MNKKSPLKNIRPVSLTKQRFLVLMCLFVGVSLLLTNTSVGGKIAALFSVKAQSEETADRTPSSEDGRISPEVLRQIESLLREKESRASAEQKIDSNLLYQIKCSVDSGSATKRRLWRRV